MGFTSSSTAFGKESALLLPCHSRISVHPQRTITIQNYHCYQRHCPLCFLNLFLTTIWFHSELAREKIWSRIHITPLLQAEEDRDQVRRHLADKAREKELLGTDSKIYHSDRYGYPISDEADDA